MSEKNGWKEFFVGDLIEAGHAETKTGPFGTQLKASSYVDFGTPVINVRNIGFGNIRPDKLEFIGADTVERLSTHLLLEDDIVFGRKGAVERHAFIRPEQRHWFQGSDCLRLRFNANDLVLPRFVSYFLLTEEHKSWMMNQCSHGATMASLNQDIISRIPLRLPLLRTQRKIASILSAYDDLIENNTRRIAILEEMAQAIYREWFVNFRFPGHENVKLVQSTLGMIPEGWECVEVSELFETVGGGTPSKVVEEYWTGGDIPWFAPSDLTKSGNMYSKSSGECITEAGLKNSSAKMFPAYSVMLTSRATIGVLSINTVPACTNQGFITCIPNKRVSALQIFFWLREQTEKILNVATGATFKEITKGNFRKFPFLVPSPDVAEKFNRIVEPLGKSIEILIQKQQILRTTRDLLLPKLISGKLDVEELDIDLGITAEETGEPTAKPVERKPSVRAAAEIDSASTASTTSTPEPIPIDELDVDQVMAEFRQQARRLGTTTRAELLKAVSQELGYKRLGHNIEEVLKGQLRAAIRRKIIAADGELVCLHTPSMETYERDELIDAFHSVMRKNTSYEREDVIRALANHLGFRRISDTVREPIKSAINAAIRRSVLDYKGELIWRGD